jgi:hypothetical protein
VLSLDQLTAWDTNEFDAALSPRWEAVLQIAGRYFRIAALVHEHPRASFDRSAYVAEHESFNAIFEPRLENSNLPNGISVASEAIQSSDAQVLKWEVKSLHELSQLDVGDLVVLIGEGGIGKSTVLSIIRANAIRNSPNSTLPVLISLVNYTPGNLDRLIHQEIGVLHGTWRSLPDRVLLLCDGLNECPSASVSAFLEELKYLLKRSRVACVLSTRELNTHKNVLLPKAPIASVKVQTITPMAIRKIAEHELKDGTFEAFISKYRPLADGSYSPHLWTPFAVNVALKLWRLKADLPSTLGDMINALLRSRCEREAGQYRKHTLEPEVIMYLAGALAFQCLVIDLRLECPALDAGRLIRGAKSRCIDALGVADTTEQEIVSLLAGHELVYTSDSGHLAFGHQLLAGALAAPLLAISWKEHLHCLGDPVTDDVWVFAARTIPIDQIEDFLKAVFNTDLMLGARATRELPSEFHAIAERLLNQAVDQQASETLRAQGLYALARLGTVNATVKLRDITKDPNQDTQYVAKCALAAAGDLDYVKGLLVEVDKMRAAPIQFSGGVVNILDSAPIPLRLDLARRRLLECTPGDPVNESLSLLAYERDKSDADIVERYLLAAADLQAWQSGLYALHEISPVRAEEIYKEELKTSPPLSKASIMRVAKRVGIEVDIHEAFECALTELPINDSDPHSNFLLNDLISDVISKSVLPPNLVHEVERGLPTSGGDKKSRLWQLARCCESSSIADYAVSCIEAWGPDLGSACNYFIAQPELAYLLRSKLIELCERGLNREEAWFTWNTSRALELVGEIGFTKIAADSLSAMVQRLDRVRRAVEIEDVSSLSSNDFRVIGSRTSSNMRFHLSGLIAPLIPAASQARELLPDDVLLSFMRFDTHHYAGALEGQREILSKLSDKAIDGVLIDIKEPWTRLSALAIVCVRGSTETRAELLAKELRTSYSHPAALHIVLTAVEACWCTAICKIVIKTVAEIPVWSKTDSQFFWNFIRMVSRQLTPEDVSIIDEALPRAKTDFSRRILALWREQATGIRIGLAILSKGKEAKK